MAAPSLIQSSRRPLAHESPNDPDYSIEPKTCKLVSADARLYTEQSDLRRPTRPYSRPATGHNGGDARGHHERGDHVPRSASAGHRQSVRDVSACDGRLSCGGQPWPGPVRNKRGGVGIPHRGYQRMPYGVTRPGGRTWRIAARADNRPAGRRSRCWPSRCGRPGCPPETAAARPG